MYNFYILHVSHVIEYIYNIYKALTLCSFYWFPYIEAARTRVTENTCHVIATPCCVTTPRMRKLRGYIENTVPVLLCDVIEHAQAARTQRKHCSSVVGRCGCCLAMDLHVTIS
jgi:hypothetical protein